MTEERMRWELATLAGRLRTLEAERDDLLARHGETTRDRDLHRDQVRQLRRSRSYRVGSAIISLARPPVRVLARVPIVSGLRRRPATPARQRPERPPTATVPAHVYVAIGLTPEALRTFTRALAQRIVVNADHVPVVVTDCPSFRFARARGVVLEYVPDARTWRRHRPETPWDDLLTDRLDRLFRDHGCVRTAVIDPDRPPTLPDLLD